MALIIAKVFTFTALISATSIIQNAQAQEDCITPRQLPGNCESIRRCQPLLTLLESARRNPEHINFLRSSQCGFEGRDPKVCCPVNGQTNPEFNDSNRANVDLRSHPYLPSDCGKDLSQRIVGGERVDLDEAPWVALLEYTKPNGKVTACGGVLISKRYVLTAAHCLKGKDLPKTWRLTGVRLGEYDTNTDRDCVSDGSGGLVCADEAVTYGIEEQIVHESYDPFSLSQPNDIALIRLSRDVQFTNYIDAICLPQNGNLPNNFLVVGWGKTETKSASNIKLKVNLPLVGRDECLGVYRSVGRNLVDSQVCAGGERGKDSCRGDSGSPLMAVEADSKGVGRWQCMGVVSFGPSICGLQNWPGIYTKVNDFVPWILSHLRP